MKYLPFPAKPGVIAGSENNRDLFVRSVQFDSGYREDTLHSHPNSFEFYVVLTGSLTFENGMGERVDARKNSLVYFESAEPHRIVIVQDTANMLLLKKVGATKNQ